ncbi:hypothetical protein FOLKNPGA_00797 [Legionella sp. PC1000]|uniref:hypothetical protein n=1 Tax=Legionella sp. PC1000 TaxID=2746060 RepID=UPI0015FE2973|nr:hypothetical protein [Legionella sp. PC1000]QLZ68019.1 hypothetical protein FOLKNPGA_00797 [Legionella sp. PC1000]
MDTEVLKPLVEECVEEEKETALWRPQKKEFHEKNEPNCVLDWDDEFDAIRSIN